MTITQGAHFIALHDCSFHYSSSLSKIYLTFPIKSFKKEVVSKSVPGRFISRNCRFNFISVAGPVAVETEVEEIMLIILSQEPCGSWLSGASLSLL